MSKNGQRSAQGARRVNPLRRWLNRRQTVEGFTYQPSTTKSRRGRAKHATVTVGHGGRRYGWHPTKRPPWTVRAENRARNRRARAARRVARRR